VNHKFALPENFTESFIATSPDNPSASVGTIALYITTISKKGDQPVAPT